MQEELRLCLRQALRIGGDMGTGFFYLVLAGDETGAVYYSFKDDIPMLEGDWYSRDVVIPECLVKVSASFNALGPMILVNRTNS